MAFHELYWATLATVAPVIGLAHAVALGTRLRRAVELDKLASTTLEGSRANLGLLAVEEYQLETQLETHLEVLAGPDDDDVGPDWWRDVDNEQLAPRLLRRANQARRLERELEPIRKAKTAAINETNRLTELERTSSRIARGGAAADLIAGISWLLCTIALANGLLALAWSRNMGNPALTVLLVVLPAAALALPPLVDALTGAAFKGLGRPE